VSRYVNCKLQARMRVRLRRKFADKIDGVDLVGHSPGDLLDLSESEARLLIAEEWACPERRGADRVEGSRRFTRRRSDQGVEGTTLSRAEAADRNARSKVSPKASRRNKRS
jgi:hypothetical protein